LEIEVKRLQGKGKLLLSQYLYINAFLQYFELENSKSASFSVDFSIHLISNQIFRSTNEITYMVKISYQETIRTLIYTVLETYPDIVYTVQLLLYFLKNLRNLTERLYNTCSIILREFMNFGSHIVDQS